jgi:uncharacterized membrane protein YeaQ/YmgE (transglycosylase-associated protein family)
MDFGGFVTWVAMGVFVGWLAGVVIRDGGYGLIWDLSLGLAGSSATSVAVGIAGVGPSAGILALALAAFVGAAIVIVGQRKIWPAPPLTPRPARVAPKP